MTVEGCKLPSGTKCVAKPDSVMAPPRMDHNTAFKLSPNLGDVSSLQQAICETRFVLRLGYVWLACTIQGTLTNLYGPTVRHLYTLRTRKLASHGIRSRNMRNSNITLQISSVFLCQVSFSSTKQVSQAVQHASRSNCISRCACKHRLCTGSRLATMLVWLSNCFH